MPVLLSFAYGVSFVRGWEGASTIFFQFRTVEYMKYKCADGLEISLVEKCNLLVDGNNEGVFVW